MGEHDLYIWHSFLFFKECLIFCMFVMLSVAELFASVRLLKAKEDIMLNMLVQLSLHKLECLYYCELAAICG
jgi:hypothetical protein